MTLVFRRLNDDGITIFREYLHRLRSNPGAAPPRSILDDNSRTEPLNQEISGTVPQRFDTRLTFARWLYGISDVRGIPVPRGDRGFWAWLSLALFDHVAPADSKGRRKPGADARHIPDQTDWRRRYRHLLANPYDVFLMHRDEPRRAYVALVNPLHKPGELTEQFTSRIDIVSCPGTMALASYLYVDPATGKRRPGASGASARRFGKLMNQYTRTFDLPEMQATEFARMLPGEFGKFTAAAEAALQGAARKV